MSKIRHTSRGGSWRIFKILMIRDATDVTGGDGNEMSRNEGWTRRRLLMAAGGVSLTGFNTQNLAAQETGASKTDRGELKRIDVHHHFIPPQYLREGPP